MSKTYKHQEEFAQGLVGHWLKGEYEDVCRIIRGLKNKAQAAYIAGAVTLLLAKLDVLGDCDESGEFVKFMHPDKK